MSRTTIETTSGLYYDYLAPERDQVRIEDIARSLSMSVRFRGHISAFYSVAEHSVLVRQLVIESGRPDLGLAALLHDAHEAYVGDIPTPLKTALGDGYEKIVAECDTAIEQSIAYRYPRRVGYSLNFHSPAVVAADALALRHEAAVLKKSRGVGSHWGYEHPAFRAHVVNCWSSVHAEAQFLSAFRDEVEPR